MENYKLYNEQENNKIGIMGGTFDPIHLGHLFVAETALNNFGLQKVLFIPAGVPPHKRSIDITDSHHRLIMTALGINDNPKFLLSDMEIVRDGKSYTVNTIEQIRSRYNNTKPYLIVGTDSFMEMESWKDCRSLLENTTVIVASRLGYTDISFSRKVTYFRNHYNAKIIDMTAPILEISSSDIRKRVRNKQSIRYLVTKEVERYIKKYDLYKK